MTLAELVTRWQSRREEWARLGVSIDGARVANEVLNDLASLESAADTVTPSEAARLSGYHPESICRLIREGRLTNHGSARRPRVKLDELPRKARRGVASVAASDVSSAALARDVIAGRIGRRRS